ncbi:tissue factor pathway inhibitor a isoform X2 [Melanotaenia boesemani]|uniref:tissue factor pathway inhibitor a isoform X2 n=1 Tax=Melanotaenia boesemani TaxID=1250792 RepID=UPI001C0476FC|nr:tissue factor pathway inhibitor a isoform X2 [Melanotaenia boesemani]
MARTKCWILCAVALACLARHGSCTRHREHKAQSEHLIFNELCALKADVGPCKAIKHRFFFDVDSGQCEPFEYGGCRGNENNFETLEMCQETCVFSADKNPCHLPEAPGPCRGLLKRFFFDTSSQQCKQFYYGGCFGNPNNFRSISDCKARCEDPGELIVSEPVMPLNVTDEKRNDVSHPDICLSPIDRGTCDGIEKRYAYNPKTKRCHKFFYSGCGGNANNFLNRKDCFLKCIRIKRGHGMGLIRIKKKNIDSLLNRSV